MLVKKLTSHVYAIDLVRVLISSLVFTPTASFDIDVPILFHLTQTCRRSLSSVTFSPKSLTLFIVNGLVAKSSRPGQFPDFLVSCFCYGGRYIFEVSSHASIFAAIIVQGEYSYSPLF